MTFHNPYSLENAEPCALPEIDGGPWSALQHLPTRLSIGTGIAIDPTAKRADAVIYETETEDHEHRVKIGSQTLNLPLAAEVDIQVNKDGSGAVTVVIPADSVRVIPAGKRVVAHRKRDRERQETKPEEGKSDAE